MRILLMLSIAGLLLGGCGTKGPLYMPKPAPGEQKPVPQVIPPAPPERPVPAETIPAPK